MGRLEGAGHWELSRLQFYNQRKSEEGKKHFFPHSWIDITLLSAPPLGWAGEFSYMSRLGLSWHYGKIILGLITMRTGVPGGASGKVPAWQCRRCKRWGFDPWVRKIPWQPTPVFLPGESHGQRSLASYGPWGHKEPDATEATKHCMHNEGLSLWDVTFHKLLGFVCAESTS